jgi:HPt (histidine-containing phosphotransfer) domain-containing protein
MSDVSIFDKASYLQFHSDVGAEDAVEVLTAFLYATALKLNAFRTYTDRVEIKREAHAIKSSSATFGFARLSSLGRELEFGIDGMSDAEIQAKVAAIQEAFHATEVVARRELLGTGDEVA